MCIPAHVNFQDVNDRYQKEIEVFGITPKGAADNETFDGHKFKARFRILDVKLYPCVSDFPTGCVLCVT